MKSLPDLLEHIALDSMCDSRMRPRPGKAVQIACNNPEVKEVIDSLSSSDLEHIHWGDIALTLMRRDS